MAEKTEKTEAAKTVKLTHPDSPDQPIEVPADQADRYTLGGWALADTTK
jgi:hypothetical protein